MWRRRLDVPGADSAAAPTQAPPSPTPSTRRRPLCPHRWHGDHQLPPQRPLRDQQRWHRHHKLRRCPDGDLAQFNGPPPSGSTVTYLYYSSHGDQAAEADSNGNSTASHSYDSFGAPLDTQPANTTAHRYTGAWEKQYDTTNALILMGARPYDPNLGRFLSIDPSTADRSTTTTTPARPDQRLRPRGALFVLRVHVRGRKRVRRPGGRPRERCFGGRRMCTHGCRDSRDACMLHRRRRARCWGGGAPRVDRARCCRRNSQCCGRGRRSSA